MYNWTKVEKEIVDLIVGRYRSGEISYDEAVEAAENCGIQGSWYESYSFDEMNRRYNEDFNNFIGKIEKEELDDKFERTEEEKRLLRENPNDISLEKGILDNLQRKYDIYEINHAKYYSKVAKIMMEHDYDDEAIKEILPLTYEAIKEIRDNICKEDRILAIEKAIELATNFLNLGVNEEIVAKGTGLPIEKILELKKKMLDFS